MLFGSRLKKRFISIAGLAALGLTVHFLDVQRPEPMSLFSDVPEQAEEPDYYTVNSTFREYNEQGVLSRTLTSQRLLHYPDSERATLEQPELASFSADGLPAWTARAEEGILEGDGERFQLNRQVVVRQRSATDGAAQADTRRADAFVLHTEQLTVDLEKDQAFSREAVRLESAEGTTRAVGLEADLKNNSIRLLSQVRSEYRADSPDRPQQSTPAGTQSGPGTSPEQP